MYLFHKINTDLQGQLVPLLIHWVKTSEQEADTVR